MHRLLPAVALVLAALLAPPVVHASGSWQWLYPLPQGHDLHDVEFLTPTLAIAVGDAGTVMISPDAGVTWSAVTKVNGLEADLNRIARIDNSTAVVVGDGGVILKTTDSGTTWIAKSSGTTEDLDDVDFAGSTGLAPATTVIVKSTDSGESWAPMTPQYNLHFQSLDVVTSMVAFAVDTPYGDVWKSEDGGATWDNAVFNAFATEVFFLDEMNGAFFSYFDDLQLTTNGGATWVQSPSPTYLGGPERSVDVTDLELADPQSMALSARVEACDVINPYLCSTRGEVRTCLNGGASWSAELSHRGLNGVAVSATGVRLFVGDGGVVHRWVAPDTWENVAGAPAEPFRGASASFVDAATGIVVEWYANSPNPVWATSHRSRVQRTADGGATWAYTYVSHAELHDVIAGPAGMPAGSAYAAGVRFDPTTLEPSALLLKSTDGGVTWPELWSDNAVGPLHAITFATPTHGVAVGEGGTIAVIDNDVVTTSAPVPAASLDGVAFATPSVGIAVGSSGPYNARVAHILRTPDAGDTWSPVSAGVSEWLYGVDFATDQIGVVVGSRGTILRSTDGGASWNPVASPSTRDLRAVSFYNDAHGFIAGAGGTVLETSDGGMTWDPIGSPTTIELGDVEPVLPTTAFFTGLGQTVLRYQQTSVPVQVTVPAASVELLPNVPNPFNPTTTLRFVVASRAHVTLAIYDVAGHLVTTLVDEIRNSGINAIEWNGTNAQGKPVASGVYVSRLLVGTATRARTLVLLK